MSRHNSSLQDAVRNSSTPENPGPNNYNLSYNRFMSGFKFRTLLLTLSLTVSANAQQPTTSATTAKLIGVLPEITQLRQFSSHTDPAAH
jgi:hypothetical protein